jgi:hypothetical protein
MDATRENLFVQYDTTVVTTLHPAQGWTDPARVAADTGRSAVVMTAWNPGFERPTIEENMAANARMHADLERTGREVWRADGRAPDGTWLEEGWIIWEMPVDEGLEVAAGYGQFAIYHYDTNGRRVTIACAP